MTEEKRSGELRAGICLNKVSFLRKGRSILEEIDLLIQPGELVGLIGPNGAGKSSLMKLMMKLLDPTTGTIMLNQRNLKDFTQTMLARHLAYLSQSPALEVAFTCRELVLMGRYAHLKRFERSSARDEQIVQEAMLRTGTSTLSERLVTELSGGEQQRILMARTLAQEAKFILLDEPSANLDPRHQLELVALLESLVQEGLGVIMAIHDLSLAARCAGRLILLHRGRIVADGPPEPVLSPLNLQAVYGIQAELSRHAASGRLFVVPIQLEAQENA